MRPWQRNASIVVALGAAGFLGATVLCLGLVGPCWSAWWSYGVWADSCPAGVIPKLSVSTSALGRGVKGSITVSAMGQLYDEQLRTREVLPIGRFSPRAILVRPNGSTVDLEPERGWDEVWDGAQQGAFFLPKELPDGDYVLRIVAEVPSGEAEVEVGLPLFRPALEHILTDAPLYRAGQVVKARAVLLDAGSLAPLPERPGHWKVWDPSGELMLEEKGATVNFGVASTTFPLAPDAAPGIWQIAFESGASVSQQAFEVREYRLPRFTVDLSPLQPWFAEGEAPKAKGVARYASGAPVQNAPVRVELLADGAWPPPNDWMEPRQVRTDGDGRFEIELPRVPEDLVGKATVRLFATVTDEAGETASGAAGLLLSEEAIAVEAVTELEGGLVADANNRIYLRVTTPDGRPIPEKSVHLRREWDLRDPGLDAATDLDAVARFQLDPGQPVTVTEPALPVRASAAEDPVVIRDPVDVVTGESGIPLADLADRLKRAWRPCAGLVEGSVSSTVWARVGPGGVAELWSDSFPEPVTACLSATARGTGVRGGDTRLVSFSASLTDPGSVHLSPSLTAFIGSATELSETVDDLAITASNCVAGAKESGDLPVAWTWAVDRGGSQARFARVASDGESSLGGAVGCVERLLGSVRLREPADEDAAGSLEFSVNVPGSSYDSLTSPASWPGFSFVASVDGVGRAVLRMPLGNVPDLRLRLSEVVVSAGAEVEITAIRGPNFTSDLPDELRLVQGDRLLTKFPFDVKKRTGKFVVPNDVSGFASVSTGWPEARAVLYITPAATLDVELSSPAKWEPGGEGELVITTTDHGRGTPAGVTLTGVDSTMAAVAPLPSPDDWARVTVLATSNLPAFGMLDAKALQTGQIAGINAAQATVLRISTLPPSQPGSDSVSVSAEAVADVETPLAESFYTLYAHAKKAVRKWEKSAPAEELMSPKTMVELWEDALAAHPADDPFGRPLHLSILPADLLALVDPRVMVADGARLPEDVENWPLYVAEEAP